MRKNADEHYVLHKVMQRLSQVVSTLSIQEFREPSFLQSRNNSLPELLPLEYYVNELFQNNVTKEEKLEAKKEKEVVQSIRIEDILGSKTENQARRGGYATLLRNTEDFARPHKNYLYREVPVTNALLLGSRRDLDDLNCNAKLYCQP